MALLRSLRTQRTTTYLIYSRTSVNVSSSSSAAVAAIRRSLHTTAALEYDVQASSKTPSQEDHVQTSSILRRRQQHHQLLSRLIGISGGVAGPRHHVRYVHSGQNERQAQQLVQTDVVERETMREKRQLGKSASPKPTGTPQRDPLDVSFNDPIAAFKSKTTWELVRAYMVYMICSSEKLVEHNMTLLKVARNLLGQRLFVLLMKSSFYGHFVAGENRHTIVPTLERLRSFGVKPILDYSVEEDITQEEAEKREVESSVSSAGDNKGEGTMPQYHVDKSFADRRYKVSSARTYFYLNEATCERNMETFIKCLEAVSGATFGTGITAIKLTALGRPQLLLQLSEVIMRTRKYMEDLVGGQGNVLTHHKTIKDLEKYYATLGDNKNVQDFLKNVTSDKEGILHLFPWSGIVDEDSQLSDTFRVPDPQTGQMRRLISQIPPKEEEMFRNMIRRLNTIVKTAAELDVRIMIDAEQTYFQPAISRITLEMMRKYNKDKAIVFNTYQCYLRETFREVGTDLEQAKRQNFYFGAKLVRGAYMDQERARAQALGYPDPVNPTYEATTDMYHKTLSECLRRIKLMKDCGDDARKIGIMVASHNEDTVRFAIEQMNQIGISPEDKVICFGQLLGMCDYITFPLGQAGYSAYKYIPYGPVEEVLPYLSRRAQENKGVLKKIKKEKRLLLSEIRRRLMRGQLFYKPKGNYVPI
ncbi:proline dehydrogenase 1, mitochondrial isoform X1 [Drosophila obscura]|uniref:proline dehydrogenase 1, mitochondrial isoform X1 n=1 Tax=Drosophila obscura TaxID=7282 RepID=UPI000BA0E052|nr:proline dehydrogenase 1, mitochondrial isoform X1 [Drosophila obscura]XP_041452061.1 proline dehydrogenase 1, mitochondrial isoform X1 [Drosophila obscura]XP_041452063.1 proline dehydrogenase 1, mitochondrial isoform X1 [Drosophila obscura]XP_041452064.1 proline dehydrogenase 1, mitochondrial isoform X1 [Drosophila obscura]XP_041452065.1 proline dehydrogenase 1, mitochondrial isoform X1 [Drosophila obscura]XP_041452066.1 proline dehydrogenase 1, mitochondrial isoform X1 [Drosophila obscura]